MWEEGSAALGPREPFPASPVESGFLFRPLGIALTPCASVYLTLHLSVEPLEQGPAFTLLFLQRPWQSHWGMLLKTGREGSREGGREGGRAEAGREEREKEISIAKHIFLK